MKVKHYERLAATITERITHLEVDEAEYRRQLNELTKESAEVSRLLAETRGAKATYESALIVIGELRALINDPKTELTGHAIVGGGGTTPAVIETPDGPVNITGEPSREQRRAVKQMLDQALGPIQMIALEDDGAHPEYGVGHDSE